MLGQTALVIMYEPTMRNQRPVPVARITGADAIAQAARHAISEAEERAAKLGEDELLAEVERGEVDRLRSVLSVLCPSIA